MLKRANQGSGLVRESESTHWGEDGAGVGAGVSVRHFEEGAEAPAE
jgi:hypothetical protein